MASHSDEELNNAPNDEGFEDSHSDADSEEKTEARRLKEKLKKQKLRDKKAEDKKNKQRNVFQRKYETMIDKAQLSDEGDRPFFKSLFSKAWESMSTEERQT